MAAKIGKISGFPEWLPEQRLVEESIIDRLKALASSYGFVPIETPAVELYSSLAAKGVVDKEIYLLRRAQLEEGAPDDGQALALHFDLTVPFARYTAQHLNDLVFPFKRYQVQKAWRGDRPQRGRFREFYQFDLDIIARDELPLACDAEVVTLLERAFAALPVESFRLHLNNRKILIGAYRALGLNDAAVKQALIIVDKGDKIGAEAVERELHALDGLPREALPRIMEISAVRVDCASATAALAGLKISSDEFDRGASELEQMLSLVPSQSRGNIVLDLSLVRGLEYYTGVILEVKLPAFPQYGSVGGGGRYENLAGQFSSAKLPGVGVSVGVTRIMDLIVENKLCDFTKRSTAELLVTVYDEKDRPASNDFAARTRAAGVNTEVFYRSSKLGKQIEYAESKGIRFVAFLNSESGEVQIKDLATKSQSRVDDPESWCRGVKGAPAR